MPLSQHEFYFESLKEWLRTTRLPGDRGKLHETLGFLKKLDLRLEETERVDLRELLRSTFSVSETELERDLPSKEETPAFCHPERPPFPACDGFVGEHLDATAEQESPESFHAFALLTCLGASLGRRVWIDMTWFKVWPNLSVVLSGPAGGPRKNTAWEMALSSVKGAFKNWAPKIISDASPQAMVEELGKEGRQAVGLLYAPEFRTFFPSQQYMEGAIPVITRLLDNPDYHPVARIMRKAVSLRNVTLSLAGGSTLDWLGKLPEDAQGGGFFTRVMIIHEEKSKPPKYIPSRGGAANIGRLQEAIDRFAWGEIKLTKMAREWYKGWYEEIKKVKAATPRLTLYYNRKQMHLLRIAMLMRLPARSLKREHLEKADEVLTWVEQPLSDVYRIIGMSRAGETTRAVLDTLRSLGGRVPFARAMRELKGLLNARDFRLAIDTLRQAGQIKEINNPAEHLIVVTEVNLVE